MSRVKPDAFDDPFFKDSFEDFDKDFENFDKKFNQRWRLMNFLIKSVMAGLVFLFVVGGCVAGPLLLHSSKETRTFTVEEKERGSRSSEGDAPYLIYTDKGVFSVEDSLLFLKFDSSDRYGKLDVGKTYTCTVAGWRIRIASAYENILDCKEW